VDAQTKAKVKWKDIYKYDVKSLQDAQLLVAKEKQDLKSINKPALQNEIESLNAAIRYIADGNAAEAEAVMGRLRPNKNSLMNKKVFDEYDKKLKELQMKIAKEMKATKAAAATTAAPAPGTENAPDAANPIAEALAKKKAAAKAKDDARIARAKADAAGAGAGSRSSESSEEDQTMLQKINKYIPYIGAGLLVVLIIAMVMGKKKKEDED
jgi:cobalamin biosynthesis Mg chelatase CobN